MNINPEQLHTYKTLLPVRRGQTTSAYINQSGTLAYGIAAGKNK
jgi:hypothetical protein